MDDGADGTRGRTATRRRVQDLHVAAPQAVGMGRADVAADTGKAERVSGARTAEEREQVDAMITRVRLQTHSSLGPRSCTRVHEVGIRKDA